MAIQYNPYTKQYSDVSAQPDTAGAVKGNTQAATGGTPPPANLLGAPSFNYNSAYGGLPQVPNPAATQGTAIGGNQGNLGGLSGLSTQLNTLIAGNAALPYQLNLPNYAGNLGQAVGNTSSLLKGQIPTDIMSMINQQGAERGVGMGSPGSANTNAATLRALGLTGLGLQQQGLQNFGSLVGMTPTGKQFDPSSFLTSPSDQQTAQYLANLLNAAPVPGAAANANIGALLAGLGRGGGNTNPLGGLFGSVKPEPIAPDTTLPDRNAANAAAWAPGGAFNPTQPPGHPYPGSPPSGSVNWNPMYADEYFGDGGGGGGGGGFDPYASLPGLEGGF